MCIPQTSSPQLLVSVKSVAEARLAQTAGVDWIDLKDPDAGPLGRPDTSTLTSTLGELSGCPKLSVALGELSELESSMPPRSELDLVRRFPVAKLALAGTWNSPADKDLVSRCQRIFPHSARWLVPVAYGDYQLCAAPPLRAVLEIARELDSQYLLVDTCTKDGRSLLDFVEHSELAGLIASARELGIDVVLAGSLRMREIDDLWNAGAAAFGIRGAVCKGTRRDDVSLGKLREWTKWFQDRRSPNSGAEI